MTSKPRGRRPAYDFSGFRILITGATSGIGHATSVAFARAGTGVVCSGRDERRAEQLMSELAVCAQENHFVAADLNSSRQCTQLIVDANAKPGGLGVIVNSAGVIHRATAEHTTDERWQQTFAINTMAPFVICRTALPLLRENGGGTIVNVASIAGLSGGCDMAAYCAGKGALLQLTRAMARDHGPQGMRAVAFCPGDVDTAVLRGEFAQLGIDQHDGLSDAAERLPLRRVCDADEIADLVLYAASDAARSLTGFPLVVDGGNRA